MFRDRRLRLMLGSALFALVLALAVLLALPDSPDSRVASTSPPPGPAPAIASEDPPSSPPARLSGVVLDGETREPVPEARVHARGSRETATDADDAGRFELELLRGEWMLWAGARGFAPPLRHNQVNLRAGEELRDVRLHLFRVVSLSGRVVHRGRPVSAAALTLLRLPGSDLREPESSPVPFRSGPDGAFAFQALPGRLRVIAEAVGFAQGESREVELRGGETARDLVIELSRRGGAIVQVVEAVGKAVVGARIEPEGRDASQATDSAGRASFDDLPAGEVRFRVAALGYGLGKAIVDVPADAIASVTVTLRRMAGVFGRVIDADRRPVRVARVRLRPVRSGRAPRVARSDRHGEFRFEEALDGVHEVVASHPRYAPSPAIVLREAVTGIELMLGRGGEITGVVRTAVGQPVRRFWLVVERFVPAGGGPAWDRAELGRRHFAARAFDSPEGAFVLVDLAPGTYDLRAEDEGSSQGGATGVEVRAERRTAGVVVVVDRGARLTGRVLDAQSREPISGAAVSLGEGWSTQGLRPRGGVTGELGEFALEGLAPGRRMIRIAKEGYVTRLVAGLDLGERDERFVEVALWRLADPQKPKAEFFGIGAVLTKDSEGGLEIVRLLGGGPGARLGLQRGDVILRVDGQEVAALGFGRAVERIRGDEGTALVLEVLRRGEPFPFEMRVERGRIVYDVPARRRR